jgi:hypothetical protein
MSRRKGNRGMLEVMDRLRTAFEREREHRRRPPWPLEMDTTWAHVFRCACCGRQRREEHRREPRSEVCSFCVAEAGQEN